MINPIFFVVPIYPNEISLFFSVSKYFLVPTKALSEPAALSASWAGWKPESFEREFDKSTSDESLQTRGAVLNPQK